MADQFGGFRADGTGFLRGLAQDNTKDFFEAGRATYENALRDPMRPFVTEVLGELRATVDPEIEGEPKVGRSLFRINRDLRFSKDKTPYNPYLDAIWWQGSGAKPRENPAFIFRLTSDTLIVGCGLMGLRGPAVEHFRAAVDDPKTGVSLVGALAEIRSTYPTLEVTEPTRKRVPKPYAADHERAGLLRLDGIHASVELAHPKNIATAQFATWVAEQQAAFAPLHHWLVKQLG